MIRILYFQTNGDVYFQGKKSLVQTPGEAHLFEDFDKALDQVRDTVHLNLKGISQVRIMSVES